MTAVKAQGLVQVWPASLSDFFFAVFIDLLRCTHRAQVPLIFQPTTRPNVQRFRVFTSGLSPLFWQFSDAYSDAVHGACLQDVVPILSVLVPSEIQ